MVLNVIFYGLIAMAVWPHATAYGQGFPTSSAFVQRVLARDYQLKRLQTEKEIWQTKRRQVDEDLPQSVSVVSSLSQSFAPDLEQSKPVDRLGLQVAYDIYDFGKKDLEIEALGFDGEVYPLKEAQMRQDITYIVIFALVDYMQKHYAFEAQQDVLRITEKKMQSVKQSYRDGLKPESDVVLSAAEVESAKLNLMRATQARDKSFLQLRLMVGEDLNTLPEPRYRLKLTLDLARLDQGVSLCRILPDSDYENMVRQAQIKKLEAEERRIHLWESSKLVGQLGTYAPRFFREDKPPQNGRVEAELRFEWKIPVPGVQHARKQGLLLEKAKLTMDEQQADHVRADQIAKVEADIAQLNTQKQALEAMHELRKRQYKLISGRYYQGQSSLLELSAAELEVHKLHIEKAKLFGELLLATFSLVKERRCDNPDEILDHIILEK